MARTVSIAGRHSSIVLHFAGMMATGAALQDPPQCQRWVAGNANWYKPALA
jgi:hypothetical protein